MPNCANIAKYDITEVANETFPVPSGNKIRDTYGKVINGDMNCDIVKIAFITKFNFKDFCFMLIPLANIFLAIYPYRQKIEHPR